MALKEVIFINRKAFFSVIVLALIFFAVFTTIYLNNKNNQFTSKKYSFKIPHDCAVNNDWESIIYKDYIQGLEPGNYNVDIDPVGKNLTFVFKSSVETIKIYTNKSIRFSMEIKSTVWYSFIIKDPPIIDYDNFTQSLENSKLFIALDKLDGNRKDSTYYIWGIAITGGVVFAANEARIYRKERE
ncbi:MAG: hypothetical protein R6W73_06205 [Candidatus Saliniplasma sp.]